MSEDIGPDEEFWTALEALRDTVEAMRLLNPHLADSGLDISGGMVTPHDVTTAQVNTIVGPGHTGNLLHTSPAAKATRSSASSPPSPPPCSTEPPILATRRPRTHPCRSITSSSTSVTRIVAGAPMAALDELGALLTGRSR